MRKEDAGMLKRLKFMFSLFDKIVVGILFVTAIYIPVFYGWNTVLYPEILWHILFLSIICMLGSVLLPLEGEKEVSRNSLLFRNILYFIYINMVVLCFGVFVEWFSFRNWRQLLGMLAAISFVYAAVMIILYWLESREAERINQKLKERR